MDAVYVVVRANCVHIGVEAVARLEAKVRKGHALPLGKGLDNLHLLLAHVLHREGDGPFYAVEVVVYTTAGLYEKRARDTT